MRKKSEKKKTENMNYPIRDWTFILRVIDIFAKGTLLHWFFHRALFSLHMQ